MSDTPTPPQGEASGDSAAKTFTIKSPNPEYNGENSSVVFRNGEGITDNESVAKRFEARGYTVSPGGSAPTDVPPASVVAPTSGIAALSRDAAVVGKDAEGPVSDAFLPPMGAGEGNDPHSTEVVSPGLHAVAPGPLVPGEVSSRPEEQEQRESTEAAAVLMEGESVEAHSGPDWGGSENEAEPAGPLNLSDPASVGQGPDAAAGTEAEPDPSMMPNAGATPTEQRPAGNATKETWVAYAVAHGMTSSEAESLSRDALVERFPKEEA